MAKHVCKRCGYQWEGVLGKPPKCCPKCKSYEWNKEKKRV